VDGVIPLLELELELDASVNPIIQLTI